MSEPEVRRPEVVPPRRDAVRLVHDEERHALRRERRAHVAPLEPLGRDVHDVALPARDRPEGPALLSGAERRVEPRRGDGEARELVVLIAHEREERRHDDDRLRQEHRRVLDAERLPGASREEAAGVLPGEHGFEELALSGTERADAEVLARDALGVGPGAVGEREGGGRVGRGTHRWCVPFGAGSRVVA